MKVGFFITARLKSSRLKQKILLDLNGKTVLDRVIERAKKVTGIDGVVLCTSTNPQDSVLYNNALSNQIQFYAGSEDDVLLRLYNAARYYRYDGLLSITADNPLHSYSLGSIVINQVLDSNFDFVFSKGLPLGIVPYYLRTDALDVAIKMKESSDTEVWGPFVDRPDFFNILKLNFLGFQGLNKARLTCDYIEDYKLLRTLYNAFETNHIPSIFEIEDIIKKGNKVLEINAEKKQLVLSEDVIKKIQQDFNHAVQTGKDYISKKKYHIKPGITNLEIMY